MNQENQDQDKDQHSIDELCKLTKDKLTSQLIAKGLPQDFAAGHNIDILANTIVKATLEEMKILPKDDKTPNP
ncbi:MAG: hypothetical protein V1843_03215 [bacterium]